MILAFIQISRAMMSGIVMIASFVVCWMPYYSYGVLYLIKPKFAIKLPIWFPMMLHAFGHLHACVNPLIYGYQAIKMFTLRKVLQQTAIRKRRLDQVLRNLINLLNINLPRIACKTDFCIFSRNFVQAL